MGRRESECRTGPERRVPRIAPQRGITGLLTVGGQPLIGATFNVMVTYDRTILELDWPAPQATRITHTCSLRLPLNSGTCAFVK